MAHTTPYTHIPPTERHKIVANVDPRDAHYIKHLFPMRHGIYDYILSTLFHRFIQHLKQLETLNGSPIEPAWFAGSPTYQLLDIILARCDFADIAAVTTAAELRGHAAGRAAGTNPGHDDAGRTGSVCPEVRSTTLKRTNTKGQPRKRSNGRGREAAAEEKGQCSTGTGVSQNDAETQDTGGVTQ